MGQSLTLDGLAARVRGSDTPALELRGVDPMIYVIYALQHDSRAPIVDRNGKALAFRSRGAALEALRECGVTSIDFVHRSSYGEMVGLEEPPGSNELRERLVIPPA